MNPNQQQVPEVTIPAGLAQEKKGVTPPSSPEIGVKTPQQEKTPFQEMQSKPQAEQEGNFLDEAIDGLKKTLKKPKKKKGVNIPQVRDELTMKVETIMEDGLKDAFTEMTPVQKQEFKIKGEQTAIQIRQLLGVTRVKVKSVFKLLVEWLKLLPGVNRFFIEQEAKIKADKIISLKNHHDS